MRGTGRARGAGGGKALPARHGPGTPQGPNPAPRSVFSVTPQPERLHFHVPPTQLICRVPGAGEGQGSGRHPFLVPEPTPAGGRLSLLGLQTRLSFIINTPSRLHLPPRAVCKAGRGRGAAASPRHRPESAGTLSPRQTQREFQVFVALNLVLLREVQHHHKAQNPWLRSRRSRRREDPKPAKTPPNPKPEGHVLRSWGCPGPGAA